MNKLLGKYQTWQILGKYFGLDWIGPISLILIIPEGFFGNINLLLQCNDDLRYARQYQKTVHHHRHNYPLTTYNLHTPMS